MRLLIASACAAALLTFSVAHAQTSAAPIAPVAAAPAPAAPAPVDYSKVEVKATELAKDTYLLTGQGGNITLVVGKKSAFIIDTQFAPLHDKIKAAITTITQLPLKYVSNTHYHGDHSGGNAGFAGDGAIIVAQENLKKRLVEGVTNPFTGNKTPPAPEAGWPTKTFGKSTTLSLGSRSVKLQHFPNAHTDGDTYMYLKDANVLATGDIVSVGNRYPNIDVSVGGGIDGMIAAVDTFLKIGDGATKIIPGHGPIMTKADLTDYRANLFTARTIVAPLVSAGKTEDEVVAANPLAALSKKVGASEQGAQGFTRNVYRSLKAAQLAAK